MFCLSVSACSTDKFNDDNYQTLHWKDLLPESELEVSLYPNGYLGSSSYTDVESNLDSNIRALLDTVGEEAILKASESTAVVENLFGKQVKLAGFVVPLEFGETRYEIKQFFLVPYYGACVHLPPPAPNQLVFVNTNQSVSIRSLKEPVWIYGVLNEQLTEHDLATSAYSMELEFSERYYQ